MELSKSHVFNSLVDLLKLGFQPLAFLSLLFLLLCLGVQAGFKLLSLVEASLGILLSCIVFSYDILSGGAKSLSVAVNKGFKRLWKRNSTYQSDATCSDEKHDRPFKPLVLHKAFHLVTYAHPYHVTGSVVKPCTAATLWREAVVNFIFPDVQRTATQFCVCVTWVWPLRRFLGCWLVRDCITVISAD